VSKKVVEKLTGEIPILGVCLGMQVIASVAGVRVHPAKSPVHGKTAEIRHDRCEVYSALVGSDLPDLRARGRSLESGPAGEM